MLEGRKVFFVFSFCLEISLFFRMVAASTDEPAYDAILLKYNTVSVSVTVTSQVTQRPSCHGYECESIRTISVLRFIMEENLAFDNERQIRSFTE